VQALGQPRAAAPDADERRGAVGPQGGAHAGRELGAPDVGELTDMDAHAEAEIAYMDLFHTITPAFLRAYQQARKLHPEYHRVRKHVYQLYELVNHLNVFGNEYLRPLLATVERVGALV